MKNQVNFLVERWKKKALKPVRGTDRFQELKEQLDGQIFSQAPYPWFNRLMPSHIQHFVHENEDLLGLSSHIIRKNYSTRTAIFSEFRKQIPFVKPGEPLDIEQPLIRHNHLYSSDILNDLLLHLKPMNHHDIEKTSSSSSQKQRHQDDEIKELNSYSNTTTTTSIHHHYHHKMENKKKQIYVRLEAKSIQFSEGYQKAWKYTIEINDIWNALFFHMKRTENSMYDALVNINSNHMTSNHTASISSPITYQIQLALHLLHIYRAECLESDLLSSKIDLNTQRNHLANLLQTHFHSLFNVLVDDNSVWNEDAQRASANRIFFFTQMGLATSWIMPRFLYFMYKTQIIPHEPPVISNSIQAYHAGSLTMIHFWHLHAALANEDSLYKKILSGFYASFLILDAGRNWTNMLLFRNHPHYQLPDPFLYLASNHTLLEIFSPVLIYLFAHFLAILWMRAPMRVTLGADVLIMLSIAFTTWVEFEFIQNFHQRRRVTQLYHHHQPSLEDISETSSRFEYFTSIFFSRDYVRNTFSSSNSRTTSRNTIDSRPRHPGMHQLRLSNLSDTALELWSLFQYGCLIQVANTSSTNTILNNIGDIISGGGNSRVNQICSENDDTEFRNFLDGVNLDLDEKRKKILLQQDEESTIITTNNNDNQNLINKKNMEALLLHLNASNSDTIVLFNMLKPLSSYFIRMFSSVPTIIHDVSIRPPPFNEKCIVVASEEAVQVIRQYASQIFAQQLYNIQEGIQKERASALVDSWRRNIPKEIIHLLLNGKRDGCITLSMPSEAWVTEPHQVKYTIDLKGIEIISNLNRNDREILKSDFMAYKIRTFSKQKPLPLKFQLIPYDDEMMILTTTQKKMTLIECLRQFLLPAILLDISTLHSIKNNPCNTLQSWIENIKEINVGMPSKHDISIFKHAIALSYLSLLQNHHQSNLKLQNLMISIHQLTLKQFWPIACSPIWFYRTRAVANIDLDIFDWTETFLNDKEGTLTNYPFNLDTCKAILNGYFKRKETGLIEDGSEAYAFQSITNSTSKRAFLLLKPDEGHIIAKVNAMHLLCMGRLPRPIPWDLSEEKDITIVYDFIKRYPRVYTLQLMKLFASHIILQNGHTLLPPINFFSLTSHSISTPNDELHVVPAIKKLRNWILYAKNEFHITWDEMTEHLFFLFNFWHLYSNIPYANHLRLDPIHYKNNEVMHKVTSAWSELDPLNFHQLDDFFQNILTSVDDMMKKAYSLGEINQKIAQEFWHLLKFSKKIYKQTEF